MFFRLCVILFIAIQQTTFCFAQQNSDITVIAGEDVSMPCTSEKVYPKWIGPEVYNGNTIAYNNGGKREFANPNIPGQKKARLDWDSDNKGLIIKDVFVTDRGLYQCAVAVTLSIIVLPQTPVILNTESSSDNTFITRASQSTETKLVCVSMGGYPEPRVQWYRGNTGTQPLISSSTVNTGSNSYNVTQTYTFSPQRQDDRVKYICQSSFKTEPKHTSNSNVVLVLNFSVKASTTKIIGNQVTIATGSRRLTLNCTTGSSNPASDIVLKNGPVTISNNQQYTNWKGENNGIVRSQNLELYPTRYMDGDVITCSVSNMLNLQSPVNDTAMLDLHYRPMVNSMSDVVVVEGNKTELICSASSKPASTFTWYRGQSGILHQGTGTPDGNTLTYTINDVRRTDTATYRCNADNSIETPDNKNVVLIVYYPPDVIPETKQITVKNKTAVITCNAKGVPGTHYTYGQWEQRWQGYDDPVSKRPGNEKLVLINLTYEHSGVYTCSASNGIRVFGTDKTYMEGSVHLLVKSFPIITDINGKSSARLRENATVEVYYYSNIEGTTAKVYRTMNTSRQKELIYSVSQADEEVNLPVFERNIKTDGTRALIMIQIHLIEDLGFYDVVISNEIGSSTKTFEIVPKGPPSAPYNVSVHTVHYNSARLSWRRGYHGGLAQTFVIQMSTDLKNWKTIEVFDGKNEDAEPISRDLLDLHASTTYHIQMYTFNSEGKSSMTENLNFTTLSKIGKESETTEDSSTLIVGIVLGAVIVILATYAVYVTILLKSKHVQQKGISEQATEQTYVNLAVSAQGIPNTRTEKEQRNNTFKDDTSDNQYTSLDKQNINQESTYDAISAM